MMPRKEPLIQMCDFTECIRKQILFQVGKGGRRKDMYYTAYNNERRLPNNTWGMVVFIHCALQYGFSEIDIRSELNIPYNIYKPIADSMPEIIKGQHPNRNLVKTVYHKIRLVQNYILFTHGVKPF